MLIVVLRTKKSLLILLFLHPQVPIRNHFMIYTLILEAVILWRIQTFLGTEELSKFYRIWRGAWSSWNSWWVRCCFLVLSLLTNLEVRFNEWACAVADPGFPRRGCPSPYGGCQPTIWRIFPKNSMKMKTFCSRGGHEGRAPPLDPPLLCAKEYTSKRKQSCLNDWRTEVWAWRINTMSCIYSDWQMWNILVNRYDRF